MRVLSGIQPTGRFHWGNYFGAIRQYIQFQEEDESYYFIANLHALTTVRDPDVLRGYTRDAALDLLALGLDPAKATLYVQSDVPEVSELTWILTTSTNLGRLQNCHAYKDKIEKGLPADTGLLMYPVLMAADILAYDANIVPVGQDQIQHIEVTRELARSFNHHFNAECFVVPEGRTIASAAKVPGTDGEKMSKSYNNTIPVFEDEKPLRKRIMKIATDSRKPEEPKDPETDHLFQLFSLFADDAAIANLRATYEQGGFGYGDVKKALAELAVNYFAEANERRKELAGKPEQVDEILAAGATCARAKAGEVLRRVQDACGLKGW
jgi:tryptophanyl-tRNA synthetase